MDDSPKVSRSCAGAPGAKPRPSSTTSTTVVSPSSTTRTVAVRAWACLRTFVSASWTTRITWTSTAGASARSRPAEESTVVAMPDWRENFAAYASRDSTKDRSGRVDSRRPRIASRTSV